jgi:hypothetical protein
MMQGKSSRRSGLAAHLAIEVLEDRSTPGGGGADFILGGPKDDPGGARYSSAEIQTQSRPLTGQGSGAFTDAAGGFFATGTMSHLGLFTHYGTLVLTPTADPAVFTVTGRLTYEAANGDKLYADLAGTLNVLTGVATGTDTWVGGTGRFADASGSATVQAQLYPDGTLTFSLEGDISY